MFHQSPAIALDRLVAESGHRIDAGLEFPAHGLGVKLAQLADPPVDFLEPFVGSRRQVERQQIDDDALDVIHPVLGIDLIQAPQGLVVGGIILQQHEHLGQELLAADLVLAQVPGVLVDDLGGRQLVAHFGIDPHQQVHVIAVGAALDQHALQLDRDVAERAQFRGQQHQLTFGEAAAGRTLHAYPDLLPLVQGVLLAFHHAIQPRQAHLFVVTQSALTIANRLEYSQRVLGTAQSFIRIGQVAPLGGIGRKVFLQADQDVQRLLVLSLVQPGAKQE